MESARTPIIAANEARLKVVDAVVFIKDLDGFYSNKDKVKRCYEVYNKYIYHMQPIPTYLLMNVYEAEAIIFSDAALINRYFKIKYNKKISPCMIANPKEELIRITSRAQRRYSESLLPDIFSRIDFDKALLTCISLQQFEQEFSSLTPVLNPPIHF